MYDSDDDDWNERYTLRMLASEIELIPVIICERTIEAYLTPT